ICGTGSFNREFVFRGQREIAWELQTSFDRAQPGTLVEREKFFDDALRNFAEHLEFDNIPRPPDEQLAGLAQHYGMPTRILDWSYSPYVAMFFACAGALESGTRPALFVLHTTQLATHVSSSSEVEMIAYQPNANERLRSQRGCFTRLKGDFLSLDDFFSKKRLPERVVTKIKVGKAVVNPALEQLFSMDITYERLFPGVEGKAKQAWLEHLLRNS
ncbi:MAG: FRG domain-containing protein, partial [Pseudomonadota bacterium]